MNLLKNAVGIFAPRSERLARKTSPDLLRTHLANDRTFLAFIRTALTLFIVGVTFIRFFDAAIFKILGWFFVPISIVTFFVGFVRYTRTETFIAEFKKDGESKESGLAGRIS